MKDEDKCQKYSNDAYEMAMECIRQLMQIADALEHLNNGLK